MAVRTALLLLFRRIARIYFREIEVAGEVPSHDVGGRLFGANHVNGLVDPILVLTQAPCVISPVAKSTLWKVPGLRFLLDAVSAVPIVRRRDVPGKSESDNEAVFSRVAKHLTSGGNILIFPEGTSHNEPHLLDLRSGAGRMLARAQLEDGRTRSLTFQAVALEFDERDVFRSRALVLFGPVRKLDELPGKDLATEVTDVMREDLSELLVEGSTWEERVLVVRVAEMFANEAEDVSLENLNRVGRRIEQARRVLANMSPEEVKTIEDRLRAYGRRLDLEETSDDRVARVAHGRPRLDVAPREAAFRAALMVLTLPLAAFAAVVYWLPYQLPRFVTKKLNEDPDTASTYKLGVGLVVSPVWAAIAIAFAFWRLPTTEYALAATALLLVSPFAALAWLDRRERFADWGDRLGARASILASSEEQEARLVDLAKERSTLMQDLELLRAKAEEA
jgi:1-acyl-sn-glycerol-3-phosphate acyltransferase